jgi:DNA repair photolyase
MNESENDMKIIDKKGLKIIYSPKGRALEYADYALNLSNSCSFGCKYCYVPAVLHKDRNEFHTIDALRKDVLEKVEHDAKLVVGKAILLCFTCDCYQDIDQELQLTRKVMEIFNRYGVNWIVLTKGGTRAIRDFDLYKPGDSFGSTLTFTSTDDSRKWEPNAAIPMNRIAALNYAHKNGIKTWVSMEPVLDPEQTLELISLTHDFVDLYKVGKLNSDNCRGSEHYEELKKIERTIDWRSFGRSAEIMLKGYGKEFYIKEDLQRYMK